MNEWSDPELGTETDDALRRALRQMGGSPAPADATLTQLRPTMRRARRRHRATVAIRTGALGVVVVFGAVAVGRSLAADDQRRLDVVSPGETPSTVTSTTVDIGDSATVEASTTVPTTTSTSTPAPGPGGTTTPPSGGPTVTAPPSTTPTGPGVTAPGATVAPTTAPAPVTAPTSPSTTVDDSGSDEDHSDEDTSDETSDERSDEDNSGSGSSGSGSGGSGSDA